MSAYKKMETKRLLVISHNIVDESNNVGKTIISLLKRWPSHQVFSIYLRNEVRETMYCKESFMITDKDILKNALIISPKGCGRIISDKEKNNAHFGDAYAYRVGNRRYPIISLIRDILWYKKSWKTSSFSEWIKKVSPDLILFVPNDYTLAFEIADFVKDITNAPMITFFTDDSFYYGQKTGLIDSIRRKWLLKDGRIIVGKSEGLICASSLMQREYKSIFGRDSKVFGNCVELTTDSVNHESDKHPFIFSYVGNLHSNRWQSLLEIGACLDLLNNELDTHCILNVYSASDLDNFVLKKLKAVNSIDMKGAVPPSDVKMIQERSDALVHIEAFDYKSKLSTRLSMSTKIFEYMARNVPIFAYGPNDISSITFLQENSFACVCTSNKALKDSLKTFITENNLRSTLREKSYEYAKLNFEESIISRAFDDFAKDIMMCR